MLGVAKMPGVHYGVQQATTNWWYGHNVLGLWFTPVSVGIIYTSVVLLAGFSLFAFSHFGGIRALGVLTTITLLVAMLTNLLVLPALLLSLNKRIMSRAFEEPLLEIMDEEGDIELMELKLDKPAPALDAAEGDEAETR